MRMMAATGLLALLAGCGGEPTRSADGAWVRLPAVPGRPAAAYFTLHGGPTDATLIQVSADRAIRTELHESMKDGMRPIASVTVPAGGTVVFAPGGRHVMLFDVNPTVKPGGNIRLTFTFADGVRLHQNTTVLAAGDPTPR